MQRVMQRIGLVGTLEQKRYSTNFSYSHKIEASLKQSNIRRRFEVRGDHNQKNSCLND